MFDPFWGRVDFAKTQLITHGDLKELMSHVVIGRAAHEFVGYGRINVVPKALPYVMDIRDVAWKGRDIFPGHVAAYKKLLG